jgi:hypothetical protein
MPLTRVLPVLRRYTTLPPQSIRSARAGPAHPLQERPERVFEPEALLREARRQKAVPLASVPEVCILDPDGDIVRLLKPSGEAKLSQAWPCYHSELYEFALAGRTAGIIGTPSARRSRYSLRKSYSLAAAGC